MGGPVHFVDRLQSVLGAPVRSFRIAYLPLLMVYFASGAMGLIAVADSFWVKKSLTLSPAELASLAVWLQLPWSIKMVVSEVVDAVPLGRAGRRLYVLLGAGLIAGGLLILAGAASGYLTVLRPEQLYVVAQLLVVIGSIVQEVVADALSAEVVARAGPDGAPRSKEDVEADLAMVQVLARLGYSIGAFIVGLLAGLLAEALPYHVVFLIGLVVPAISIAGALIVRTGDGTSRPIDWRILGGGILFAATAVLLGLSGFLLAQETMFVIALVVIVAMLRRVMRGLDPALQTRILAIAAMIFAFRAAPTLGEGYRWFLIDRHGFDERFFGVLQVTGTGIGLVAMWLLTDLVMRHSPTRVLLVLTAVAALLWVPSLLLVLGANLWTERYLGIGARTIALFDEAAQSPLALLAQVPLLTLIAVHAPAKQRATWFALAASLMSLAIVASQLIGKYLNVLFPIERGNYENLSSLVGGVLIASLILPLFCIILLYRRAR